MACESRRRGWVKGRGHRRFRVHLVRLSEPGIRSVLASSCDQVEAVELVDLMSSPRPRVDFLLKLSTLPMGRSTGGPSAIPARRELLVGSRGSSPRGGRTPLSPTASLCALAAARRPEGELGIRAGAGRAMRCGAGVLWPRPRGHGVGRMFWRGVARRTGSRAQQRRALPLVHRPMLARAVTLVVKVVRPSAPKVAPVGEPGFEGRVRGLRHPDSLERSLHGALPANAITGGSARVAPGGRDVVG